jgi:hypothetical protein
MIPLSFHSPSVRMSITGTPAAARRASSALSMSTTSARADSATSKAKAQTNRWRIMIETPEKTDRPILQCRFPPATNSMSSSSTLYDVLGVAAKASSQEIDTAYTARRQSLEGSPDDLSLLAVAYDTLRHPERRAAYDRALARRAATAAALGSAAAEAPARRRRCDRASGPPCCW